MAGETKFKYSQAGYDALVEELNYLYTVREKEVQEQLKEARSFGDLSENSEYDEAKNEQGKVHSRIIQLENWIKNAEIIEQNARSGMVSLGSKVEVRDIAAGDVDTYEIVGSQEANPLKLRVSDDSPIGSALIDRKKGETVTVHAPMGDFDLEILSIKN